MKNIAVIGTTKNLNIFNVCGAKKVFIIDQDENLKNLVENLAKEYKIILVEEEILKKNKELFLKYKNKKLPAISGIPTLKKNDDENFICSLIKKIVGNEIAI